MLRHFAVGAHHRSRVLGCAIRGAPSSSSLPQLASPIGCGEGSSSCCGAAGARGQARGVFHATTHLLRLSSKDTKPLTPGQRRKGSELDPLYMPGLEPTPGSKTIKTPESTVVRRRPSTRRGLGNRVTDEELLQQDFVRSQKEGLHVNIEVDEHAPPLPTGRVQDRDPTRPESRFWQKTKLQPFNPHLDLNQYQVSKAVKPRQQRTGMTLWTSRDRLNHAHKMSTKDVYGLVDKFAAGKWYNFIWRFCRIFDLDRLKTYRKASGIAATLLIGAMGGVLYFLFLCEMDCYYSLEERDQRDLHRLYQWIRISDFKKIGDEVMEEHDPLHVLSTKEQLELVIEECRRRGLVDLDPALARRRYNNLIRDMDPYHAFYWLVMYLGSVFGGYSVGFWRTQELVANETAGLGFERSRPLAR